MVAWRSKSERSRAVPAGPIVCIRPALRPARRGLAAASYNAPMALPPEVCIRGAGIVGRTLALLLARERVRVALVAPRRAAGRRRRRAYALNTASKTLLESPARLARRGRTPPRCARCWCTATKAAAVQFSAARQKVEALAWIVDVPALEQQLADAVRFQPPHRSRRRAGAGAAHRGLRRPHQRHPRSARRALRGHALSPARDRRPAR